MVWSKPSSSSPGNVQVGSTALSQPSQLISCWTDIATATGEFSIAVGDLASSDVGRQLSQSLSGLADVERKAQETQAQQSEQDMSTIMATVDEYARLINSVRVRFLTANSSCFLISVDGIFIAYPNVLHVAQYGK